LREVAVEAEVVLEGVDLADHVGQFVRGDPPARRRSGTCDAVEVRALGPVDRAEGEVHVVPVPGLALAGEDGVLLGAAQDESCGDVEDADHVVEALIAIARRSSGGPRRSSVVVNAAVWWRAWTPASVRLAPWTCTGSRMTASIARASSACTVRSSTRPSSPAGASCPCSRAAASGSSWRCHPWKADPS
jgi:hypothetical protein